MKTLAIIPARGGSKRIPRKNIKDFLGKPIIAYSIETAIQSGLFDEIMVSTDDEEIAEVSRKFGAKVPFFRSSLNSNDYATTIQVLKEVEQSYAQELNKKFKFVCCIYPTAPFVTKAHLVEGLNTLLKEQLDVVFPVVRFSYPIWRAVKIELKKTTMLWPEHSKTRSQDLQPTFHDAGQWYWYDSERVKDSLFTQNTSSLVLVEEEVQDIDTISDWKLAELKYRLLNETKGLH